MKNTIIWVVLGVLTVASVSAVMSSPEWDERADSGRYGADSDSGGDERRTLTGGWLSSRPDVRPVDNETYRNECGSCHFAYQPGLLSRDDWRRVMDALTGHYGDDASLDMAQAMKIRDYLFEHAADRASSSRARAFAVGDDTAGDSLPRITRTRYFRKEHSEIPARLVRDNPGVGSFSNCQACHRTADAGVFSEHQVIIPGVGRWDD